MISMSEHATVRVLQSNLEGIVADAPIQETAMNLDENGKKIMNANEIDAMSMRSMSFLGGEVFFNPVATGLSLFLLSAGIIWMLVDSDAFDVFTEGQRWTSQYFTWLYVISQDAWVIVLIFITLRFGDMKLGQDSDEPEFSDQAYFAMIFSAGIGTGLFFYGVAEPVAHIGAGNRYSNNKLLSEAEHNQAAINLTLFHWGFLAWITYSILAINLGIMSFRHGLPLTMRSTLFPLIGRHTFGFIGDLMDGFTIVVIIAGVVVSLGIGGDQIVTGLERMDVLTAPDDPDDLTSTLVCVWVIMSMAAISASTGVERGIKILSQLGICLSSVLMMGVLFAERTEFLMNLAVQSIGYHFQSIIQLSFFTDAWAQIKIYAVDPIAASEGVEAVAGVMAYAGHPTDGNSANPLWMDWWTVFYWGWWISWAPFVGIFLARISKGRTIANVVAYTMSVPFAYILVWFSIFGGAGIRMVRRAQQIQLEIYPDYDAKTADSNCFDVPSDAQDPGITPVCLYTGDPSGIFFDVLTQYGNIGPIFNILAIVAMTIYFITSSDSASLVIDALASNGNESQNPAQRVVWAIAQGALTTALLVKGQGVGLLQAFQPLLVILGLPYQVIVCLCAAAVLKALYRDKEYRGVNGIAGYLDSLDKPENGHFKTAAQGGIFNVFEYIFSLGEPVVSRGYEPITQDLFVNFFTALFVPFLPAYSVSKLIGEDSATSICSTFAILLTFLASVTSFIVYLSVDHNEPDNFVGVLALIFYCAHAAAVARLRGAVREVYRIQDGNQVEDICMGVFMYPVAITQMVDHAVNVAVPTNSSKKI